MSLKFYVENGSFHLRNLGDVAMLERTLSEIRRTHPDSIRFVPTSDPGRLRLIDADAVPVMSHHDPWKSVLRDWQRQKGKKLFSRLMRTSFREANRRRKYVAFLNDIRHLRPEEIIIHVRNPSLRSWLQTVTSCDAIVSCGGGLVNDWFPENGKRILETIGYAQVVGKPTAMFGLGLGPVDTSYLKYLSRRVLPHLTVLSLREPTGIADLFGIFRKTPNHIISGDDAVLITSELSAVRSSIGVSLRGAKHAQLPKGVLTEIGKQVVAIAARENLKVQPLPVYLAESDGDLATFSKCEVPSHVIENDGTHIDQVQQLIECIRNCRVVVTGTYHAAVFALSCGIPVVALASSKYYHRKLGGIMAQFGERTAPLDMGRTDFSERLYSNIHSALNEPQTHRDRRLAAAIAQHERSSRAYSNFFNALSRKYLA